MTERRRLLLVRHGAVAYFDAEGRPHPPDNLPLTRDGVTQARALGETLAGTRIDRVVTSGMRRTRETASHLLDAARLQCQIQHWPEFEEIRGERLSAIPDDRLRTAFLAAFAGTAPLDTPFLGGETLAQLVGRVIPALQRLLADTAWDTALVVAHGGVNRAILSWFLTGQPQFFGGLAQDPGCLNVIDVAGTPAASVVRMVNYGALDTLRASTRLTTMEELLAQYLRGRESAGDVERASLGSDGTRGEAAR